MRLGITLLLLLTSSFAINWPAKAAEPTAQPTSTDQGQHPLTKLLEIASQREKEIRSKVHDYTCVLVKRERINGKLQEYRFIETKVRAAGVRNGETIPMAVNMRFLAPEKVAGRSIVYMEGKNDNQMMVRRGGERFQGVIVNVDLNADAARKESQLPITHLGLDGMVFEIVKRIREDIKADPTGSNTQLEVFHDAKVNGRTCTHVRITHPKRAEGLVYQQAEFFVDDENHLPVRVNSYDWPKTPGGDPELQGEFTYTKVKINVGLTDADFDAERLRTASR